VAQRSRTSGFSVGPDPLGVDEYGGLVSIALAERNVLIGGEPGAGKSAALSMLLATGALDPATRVWLLDGKLVELAAWAPVAERLAGPDGEQAIGLLRDLREEMEARYRELLARGLRKVRARTASARPLGLRRACVLSHAAGEAPASGARRAAARPGRAWPCGRRDRRRGDAETRRGCRAVGAARPVRIPAGARCNTPQGSDTILGQGWASAGADASQIPGGQRGIAERAAARRADAWHAAGGETVEQGVPA
jgi:hypothetical protein